MDDEGGAPDIAMNAPGEAIKTSPWQVDLFH
jgi:hypothetical protein